MNDMKQSEVHLSFFMLNRIDNTVIFNSTIESLGYSWTISLLFQPLAHVYGFNTISRCLSQGGTTVIIPRFTLETYLKLAVKYKVLYAMLANNISIFTIFRSFSTEKHLSLKGISGEFTK